MQEKDLWLAPGPRKSVAQTNGLRFAQAVFLLDLLASRPGKLVAPDEDFALRAGLPRRDGYVLSSFPAWVRTALP